MPRVVVYLVEVHVALGDLCFIGAGVETCLGVYAMLEGDGLPEFIADLVATLANLQSKYFSHLVFFKLLSLRVLNQSI